MSLTVWKFPLALDAKGRAEVKMPAPAAIIDTAFDADGNLCVWAEVRPSEPLVTRRLAVVGTGHDIPDNGAHVGSVIDGMFVWHIYEVVEPW